MKRPAYLDELSRLSRCGEFDDLVRRCFEIRDELERRPGDAYPETALIHECLARAYYDIGDFCSAAMECEIALAIHRAHHARPSDDEVRCLNYLGRNYLWTGRPTEAEQTLAEALTLLDHLPIGEQRGRGFVLVDLAQMHRWTGELDIAERLVLQAIQPLLHYFGYGNRHWAFLYCHLAVTYEAQGKLAAADRTVRKAFRWLRYAITEDDADFAAVLSGEGLRLKKRGRLEEARAAQTEALAILQRIRKPGHYLLDRARHRLATVDEPPVSSAG